MVTQEGALRFSIDTGEVAGEISPLWFGHNLEHTRSCVWQGLSAQLVRNRKFAGMPQQHTGVAEDWYRIGPREAWHLVELAPGHWDPGTTGAPYTRHFDSSLDTSRAHDCGHQRIQTFKDGAPAGIGQTGLSLVAGKQYEGQVALLIEQDMAVKVTIQGSQAHEPWCEVDFHLVPGQWSEATFAFVAPQSDADARLEITFTQAGVLYVGAASLLPAGHFHGLRPDVVELLKQISVRILRWPGGNFADNYHWKDGLLPVDQRAPLRSHFHETLPHTHDYDMHEIGTDEYIALCREIGAEPFITINLGMEGPLEATQWVEYCNGAPDTEWGRLRAERGHPEPYNVKYWSLGNEYGYGHMLGPNDPEGYRMVVTQCAAGMRAVDPSLVFTVCGIWWDEAWHREVLAKIGDCFDYVSFHDYTRLMKDFTGQAGKDEFRRVTATAPAAIFEQVGRVRELVDRFAPAGRQIGISFDEWNVWYAWYRPVGVVEGIYTASMLHQFCRQARRLGISLGAFFEPVNEGAIWVKPEQAGLTAMGQTFALLKTHQNNQLILVAAADPAGNVDVVASLDDASGDVWVSLVNRSADEDCPVELSFRGGAGAGNVMMAEAVLLSSPTFLPESVFDETRLDVTMRNGAEARLTLPRHSIAMVRMASQ